jgi:hypothetical protein
MLDVDGTGRQSERESRVSDIFISYASEDLEWASRLAHAFQALGWSVWWDRKIITGQAFDKVSQ